VAYVLLDTFGYEMPGQFPVTEERRRPASKCRSQGEEEAAMRIAHLLAGAALTALVHSVAVAAPVTFTKLTGLTGGTLAATAVYQADLSGVGSSILSISIHDNSAGLGGSPGQFSGFDLDAIILSTTNCATAACAGALVGMSVFDFVSGIVFSPGTQRAPADPKLFGTGPGGNTVDNAVATLGLFDGESTTGPGAFGFISIGDDGVIAFNLTALVDTTGLFLYIGEVGDNGEVAASTVTVGPGRVPEPATVALLAIALVGLAVALRRKK
jgi:hypothetical protein